MPNLCFRVTGVEAVARGLAPLLHFHTEISGGSSAEPIQGLLLNAQIQLQCPQRAYSTREKEKLTDLFGTPERWGQTLRNRFWTHSQATVGAFTDRTETVLGVPCTYDLNLAAAKYLYALESGEVSLLFLFSGTVFYTGRQGQLQVERVSWNKECTYRFPIGLWRDLMEQHYPNSAWVCLRRDVFDRLYAYKRCHGVATWEEAVERLLECGTRSEECEVGAT